MMLMFFSSGTDDIYSKMAAEANDNLSDDSDIDPDKLLEELVSGLVREKQFCQVSPDVMRCHEVSPGVIRCHQMSISGIRCHQVPSGVIICHRMSSDVIGCRQVSSDLYARSFFASPNI